MTFNLNKVISNALVGKTIKKYNYFSCIEGKKIIFAEIGINRDEMVGIFFKVKGDNGSRSYFMFDFFDIEIE